MADQNQPIDPKDIEALTAGLLQVLDTELAAIDARVEEARRTLECCGSEREVIAKKRETILQAQAMQLEFLNRQKPTAPRLPPLPPIPQRPMTFAGGGDPLPIPPLPPGLERRGAFVVKPMPSPKRARIGPQRYFILTDIHQNGPTTVEEIAVRTELSLKRIKDQVRADLA